MSLNPKRTKVHVDRKRAKKRYFVIRVLLSKDKIGQVFATGDDLNTALVTSVSKCYGITGVALFHRNIRVKYFNARTCISIVRAPFAFEKMFRNVILDVQVVNGVTCKLDCIHVSGTILQGQRYLLEWNRNLIYQTGKGDKEENIINIKYNDD
jgi:RNase P/RNase MRP subunit POP5